MLCGHPVPPPSLCDPVRFDFSRKAWPVPPAPYFTLLLFRGYLALYRPRTPENVGVWYQVCSASQYTSKVYELVRETSHPTFFHPDYFACRRSTMQESKNLLSESNLLCKSSLSCMNKPRNSSHGMYTFYNHNWVSCSGAPFYDSKCISVG